MAEERNRPDGRTTAGSVASGTRACDRPSAVDRAPMAELGLAPGTVVAETYRIVHALGAGGMGVVTLAHDEKLDRDVAVKFIRPELFRHGTLRDALMHEARAMARVSHPNVLVVHALGEHEGTPYFVMEYIDGSTVEQWLVEQTAGGSPPDLDDAVRILDQVCQGVEAIHAASTVHRDLKPSNLLIDAQGRVYVSDLGVARILEDHTRGGASCYVVGSAAYMAPEAALGDETTAELFVRRDVYALGCIAYELVTGRAPFDGPSDIALMSKHLLEPPPLATTLRPDLPAAWDPVLLRAVEKDPLKRWPSAADLRRAIEQAHASAAEPTRILLADDDPDWRELLHGQLARRFPAATIDTVGDGEAAIEAFDRQPYSVVLVDLEMPEADGMVVTTQIRRRAASQRVPILVLTAAGGPGEWRRLSQIGADGFLVKPVDPDDVVALIRRTVNARRRRREAAA
jgi:serine/threonine-protein kinase